MNTEKIEQIATNALNELKAIDIKALNVSQLTIITEKMLICTGRSSVHIKALANGVIEAAKREKLSYIRTEGKNSTEWIIVDLADVVVHIMLASAREFYKLEDLWHPVETARDNHKDN